MVKVRSTKITYMNDHLPVRCSRRPVNSLTMKKFLKRLDKGLPMFVAYGRHGFIKESRNVGNLHWVKFMNGDGAQFVSCTDVYGNGYTSQSTHSLGDMGVYREPYHKWNFVFRTRESAQKWLDSLKQVR